MSQQYTVDSRQKTIEMALKLNVTLTEMSPKLKCYQHFSGFPSSFSGHSKFGIDCLGIVFGYVHLLVCHDE